jgi:hypothetical protein
MHPYSAANTGGKHFTIKIGKYPEDGNTNA